MLSHFVKDSKNGNLVGIQEILFWTIHSKGHGALVFLLPNKYTTAVGCTSAPVESKTEHDWERGQWTSSRAFSKGAISSCPATAVQERGLTGRLHVHVVDDRDSLRARLGERAMDIVEGILERKGATLIRG